jgi:hypothetical protein
MLQVGNNVMHKIDVYINMFPAKGPTGGSLHTHRQNNWLQTAKSIPSLLPANLNLFCQVAIVKLDVLQSPNILIAGNLLISNNIYF